MDGETRTPAGGTPIVLPAFGLAEDILGREANADAAKQAEPKRPEPSGSDLATKFVTFFLGPEEYALPIGQVQEINRVGEITRVPNSPAHVRGVINLRGRILPVIELKRRLFIGETALTRESRIVVVENGAKVLGLMVDRVAQVLNIAPDQIEAVPDEVVQVDKNFIRGVGKVDDRMIILLDLEKVVMKEAA